MIRRVHARRTVLTRILQTLVNVELTVFACQQQQQKKHIVSVVCISFFSKFVTKKNIFYIFFFIKKKVFFFIFCDDVTFVWHLIDDVTLTVEAEAGADGSGGHLVALSVVVAGRAVTVAGQFAAAALEVGPTLAPEVSATGHARA